jgi:hypothetical protein
MKCGEIKKNISEFIDGELGAELKPAVEEHISACSECRKEYHKLQKTVELLKGLDSVDAPSDIIANVNRILDEEPYFKRVLRAVTGFNLHRMPYKTIAAAIIAILVVYLNYKHPASVKKLKESALKKHYETAAEKNEAFETDKVDSDKEPIKELIKEIPKEIPAAKDLDMQPKDLKEHKKAKEKKKAPVGGYTIKEEAAEPPPKDEPRDFVSKEPKKLKAAKKEIDIVKEQKQKRDESKKEVMMGRKRLEDGVDSEFLTIVTGEKAVDKAEASKPSAPVESKEVFVETPPVQYEPPEPEEELEDQLTYKAYDEDIIGEDREDMLEETGIDDQAGTPQLSTEPITEPEAPPPAPVIAKRAPAKEADTSAQASLPSSKAKGAESFDLGASKEEERGVKEGAFMKKPAEKQVIREKAAEMETYPPDALSAEEPASEVMGWEGDGSGAVIKDSRRMSLKEDVKSRSRYMSIPAKEEKSFLNYYKIRVKSLKDAKDYIIDAAKNNNAFILEKEKLDTFIGGNNIKIKALVPIKNYSKLIENIITKKSLAVINKEAVELGITDEQRDTIDNIIQNETIKFLIVEIELIL